MLATIRHDSSGTAPPLVIVHGLFGSGRNWGVIGKRLSDRGPVILPDLRNHGGSPWTDSHSYPDLAGDLADLIRSLPGGGPVDLVGHSMGGKAAMWLAMTDPGLVRRLAVMDIAPVSYGHSQQPQIDAMRRVDLASVRDRADALTMMQADSPGIGSFLLQNLDLAARRWRLNLATLEREMPLITGFPDPAGLGWPGPTLFLLGAGSTYVRSGHRPLIRSLFPAARIASIREAGHWLHADRPREVEASLRAWFDA
jgi:esterase